MIEQRRSTNLKNIRPQFPWNPFNTTMVPAKKSMRMKRILDKKLISWSIRPIFDYGEFEFIFALVSPPVYATIPIMYP